MVLEDEDIRRQCLRGQRDLVVLGLLLVLVGFKAVVSVAVLEVGVGSAVASGVIADSADAVELDIKVEEVDLVVLLTELVLVSRRQMPPPGLGVLDLGMVARMTPDAVDLKIDRTEAVPGLIELAASQVVIVNR